MMAAAGPSCARTQGFHKVEFEIRFAFAHANQGCTPTSATRARFHAWNSASDRLPSLRRRTAPSVNLQFAICNLQFAMRKMIAIPNRALDPLVPSRRPTACSRLICAKGHLICAESHLVCALARLICARADLVCAARPVDSCAQRKPFLAAPACTRASSVPGTHVPCLPGRQTIQ
jgi:hypothetical protein